jgi:hypothetical protein
VGLYGPVTADEATTGGHPMTHRVGIGLACCPQKESATRKWLCGNNITMVGATGFEPVTSTV